MMSEIRNELNTDTQAQPVFIISTAIDYKIYVILTVYLTVTKYSQNL